MWVSRGENPFDKLVVPLTLLRSAYVALFTTIVAAAGGGEGLRIFLLVTAVLGTVFDVAQVVVLVWAALRREAAKSDAAPLVQPPPTQEMFPRRRIYFMRIVDTYVSATIGFGSLLAGIELVDASQFFAATPAGKPSGVWLTVLNFTFVTFQIIGGVGFGAYIPQGTGALLAVAATNLCGWVVALAGGSVIVSAVIRDHRTYGRGVYL
jgi:hypothetical protein